ncbi:hypothetical protein OHB54_01780 [Streptomyces sp. NBC_01007]|nr:hypothetical protein OHB54_01780 [Streptomyces sp. NBC_01007]
MTHQHTDTDTSATPDGQAMDELAIDDGLLPLAASEWHPEVDDYPISAA